MSACTSDTCILKDQSINQCVEFAFQHFFGNKTNGQKMRAIQDFSSTSPSVINIEPPLSHSRRCDGNFIYLRQKVTLKHCSEACSRCNEQSTHHISATQNLCS